MGTEVVVRGADVNDLLAQVEALSRSSPVVVNSEPATHDTCAAGTEAPSAVDTQAPVAAPPAAEVATTNSAPITNCAAVPSVPDGTTDRSQFDSFPELSATAVTGDAAA